MKEYQKLQKCKFCGIGYKQSAMSHQMTLKMINAVEEHMRHRGVTLEWMESQQNLVIDNTNVYESYNVCKTCFQLYEQTKELKNLELMFAEALGIKAKAEKRLKEKRNETQKMPKD